MGRTSIRWQNKYAADVFHSIELQLLNRWLAASHGLVQALFPQHRQISTSGGDASYLQQMGSKI